MIGFGAFNLLVLKPRLLQVPIAADLSTDPAPVRALIKSVLCETILVRLIVKHRGSRGQGRRRERGRVLNFAV